MSSKILPLLTTAAAAAGIIAYARFKKQMRLMRDTLDRGSTIAETGDWDIEYADFGTGEPMLVIHGAGGGYDQGLLIAGDFGGGYRVIAPSRFGYLKTPVPDDHSPAAQADAHAALLGFLGIDQAVVVAASAGAPSAIELALRHPKRVSALVLLAPRTFHPTQAIGADQSLPSQAVLHLVELSADFLFWLFLHVNRASVLRFFGVPPALDQHASREEQDRVSKLLEAVLPLSERVRGIEVDGLTEITPWPLEQIGIPTLIIAAQDDLYNTLPGARFTAEHMPSARLQVLPSGDHLMVGRTAEVSELVRAFLERARSRKQVQGHVIGRRGELAPIAA